jgi:dTDP-glucose 4,6-dehydratase
LISIEELADIILRETGADRKLMQCHDTEPFTTRVKTVDYSKARRDLKHDPQIDIRKGIRRYVEWMKPIYAK